MKDNILIRKANINDCSVITHIVTVSWNETYPGIVPDSFLKELKENEEERKKKMQESFLKDNYLVLEVDNKVVGFARYEQADTKLFPNYGEIVALYLLSDYHGKGYGKRLVNVVIKELKQMGFKQMIIACLKGNPSNEFYKHIGGKYLQDGEYQRLHLKENIYLFDI